MKEKPPQIELGEAYWSLDAPGIGFLYGSKENALAGAQERGLPAESVRYSDTRLTIGSIQKEIIRLENQALGMEENRFSCGPWDEYFSLGYTTSGGRLEQIERDWKIPEVRRRWAVYAVMGCNEGIYLHVDLHLFRPKGWEEISVFQGKTCASSWVDWQACYASAGRIAWYLGA